MEKTNYHTHTPRCLHAGGTETEYIEAAIENNMTILGFSDHAPYPDNRFGLRMQYEELDDYLQTIKNLKKQYKNQIEIRVGLEIEYDSEKKAYYEQLLNEKGVKYLVLGQHIYVSPNKEYINIYSLNNTEQYIEYAQTIKEAVQTGYFAFIAHPDVIFVNDLAWDQNCELASDIIIEAAIKTKTPLGFNANGLRRGIQAFCDEERYLYPHPKFWSKVAKTNIPVLINADAHHPSNIYDDKMELAYKLVDEWGLNLITDYI